MLRDRVTSASYVLASASWTIFGIDLTLSGLINKRDPVLFLEVLCLIDVAVIVILGASDYHCAA